MTWVIVLIVLAVVVALLLLRAEDSAPPECELEDESLATEVAITLHDIRRRLDVAWTRTELRRDHAQLRRELADELRVADIAASRNDQAELP